jgi:hypothetical protein
VEEPLFIYRMASSTKRESDYAKIESIRTYMDKKWHEYRKEGREMSCGCGAKKKSASKPGSTMSSSGNFSGLTEATPEEDDTVMVMVQYVGPVAESFRIRSVVDPSILYQFGNNPHHAVRTVFRGDVDRLTSFTDREGNSMYRVINDDKSLAGNNPVAFTGQPINEPKPA